MRVGLPISWPRRPLLQRGSTAAAWLGPISALLLIAACGEEQPERYPPASDRCGNELCSDGNGVGGGVVAGRGGNSTTPDDDATDAGASSTMPGTVAGIVQVAVSADLQTLVTLEEPVEVSAHSPDGTASESRYREGEEFELAVSGFPAMVGVRPTDPASPLMTTLQWASVPGLPLRALSVERTVVNDIAENLATGAAFLNPERGHAIVSFVNAEGAPLAGVSVTAQDATIAYDIGVFYTDAETETAERGSAVLLNAPAGNFPGSELTLRLRLAGETIEVPLPIAVDAVSIATIEWPDE